MIVPADFLEAEQLTQIALKSKAFWGYSNDLIEGWRADLTVTTKTIQTCQVYKFMVDDVTVGFYVLNNPKEELVKLEMLFVLPKFIGKGIGKKLLIHALEKAIVSNAKTIELVADPNAIPFYKSQGFVEKEQIGSAILGRFLSLMQKDLKQ
ncbi:GNAT family N-acetyltransferase [Polaribacter sp. R2A056_3_33]|uniref:GNAT family N-acetyltransferase n=1 Tax=Polaribacter sp. R2A056_3_33 TaxID=2745563 RepID=UPI001C5020EA|nr:GNAT family N-acetyltransferase [Polaribacter sp. R2A056_3_33]QXP68842.1 GNAT family N-acetyltransferase [Polaribacter sp. R2A056_3_33]